MSERPGFFERIFKRDRLGSRESRLALALALFTAAGSAACTTPYRGERGMSYAATLEMTKEEDNEARERATEKVMAERGRFGHFAYPVAREEVLNKGKRRERTVQFEKGVEALAYYSELHEVPVKIGNGDETKIIPVPHVFFDSVRSDSDDATLKALAGTARGHVLGAAFKEIPGLKQEVAKELGGARTARTTDPFVLADGTQFVRVKNALDAGTGKPSGVEMPKNVPVQVGNIDFKIGDFNTFTMDENVVIDEDDAKIPPDFLVLLGLRLNALGVVPNGENQGPLKGSFVKVEPTDAGWEFHFKIVRQPFAPDITATVATKANLGDALKKIEEKVFKNSTFAVTSLESGAAGDEEGAGADKGDKGKKAPEKKEIKKRPVDSRVWISALRESCPNDLTGLVNYMQNKENYRFGRLETQFVPGTKTIVLIVEFTNTDGIKQRFVESIKAWDEQDQPNTLKRRKHNSDLVVKAAKKLIDKASGGEAEEEDASVAPASAGDGEAVPTTSESVAVPAVSGEGANLTEDTNEDWKNFKRIFEAEGRTKSSLEILLLNQQGVKNGSIDIKRYVDAGGKRFTLHITVKVIGVKKVEGLCVLDVSSVMERVKEAVDDNAKFKLLSSFIDEKAEKIIKILAQRSKTQEGLIIFNEDGSIKQEIVPEAEPTPGPASAPAGASSEVAPVRPEPPVVLQQREPAPTPEPPAPAKKKAPKPKKAPPPPPPPDDLDGFALPQ